MLRQFPLFLIALFSFSDLAATELMPWFGIEKEIKLTPIYRQQYYNRIHAKQGNVRHHTYDNYFSLSASFAYEETFNTEIEVFTELPYMHHYRGNCEKATFRYLVADDISGESAVSIAAGLAVSHVHRPALDSISNFYHGKYEFEALLSIGKETTCGESWSDRWWVATGLGIANQHSPWVRANFSWEINGWETNQLRLFADTLWGLGIKPLDLSIPFKGYGPIRHQSVDLGAEYRHWLNDYVQLCLEYSYRVYSRNAPANTSNLLLKFFVPIDL